MTSVTPASRNPASWRLAALATLALAVATPVAAQQAQQTPRPAGQGQGQRPPAQQPAAQQPAAGSAVVALKGDPNQQEWTKVCGKDPATQRETCYTTRDFVAENDTPVLAVAVYETKGEGNRVDRQVRYLLPLTFCCSLASAPRWTAASRRRSLFDLRAERLLRRIHRDRPVLHPHEGRQGPDAPGSEPGCPRRQLHDPARRLRQGLRWPADDPKVLEEQQKKLQKNCSAAATICAARCSRAGRLALRHLHPLRPGGSQRAEALIEGSFNEKAAGVAPAAFSCAA